MHVKKIQDYFPKTVTPKEFEETMMKALEAWFENENENEHEQSGDKGLER